MSSEVVDSNPYSRLMALQRMGIVKDYERIRSKTVGPGPSAVANSSWVFGKAAGWCSACLKALSDSLALSRRRPGGLPADLLHHLN